MTDPFAGPAAIPSTFPTVSSFRGRLVLIKPLKQETVPNNLGAPGAMQERITADITVVDGLGPVPQMKGNPPTPTGQMFDGPEYRGVYVQSEVIVKQLADALTARTSVLAWIDTRKPGTQPMKGNPWGLIDATQDAAAVQTARNFLATQMVGAAAAPAASQNTAPVYAQQAPVQYVPAQPATYAAATPAQAAPVGPLTDLNTELAHEQLRQGVPQNVPYQAPPAAQPQPGPVPAGVNPFA